MGIATAHAATRQTMRPRALHPTWWLLAALALAALALAPHPGLSNPSVDAGAATQALQLQIGAAGGYRLDGKPLTREGLERALRVARGQSPQLRLWIDAVDGGDPQQLIGALAVADHAGIRNIGSRVQ